MCLDACKRLEITQYIRIIKTNETWEQERTGRKIHTLARSVTRGALGEHGVQTRPKWSTLHCSSWHQAINIHLPKKSVALHKSHRSRSHSNTHLCPASRPPLWGLQRDLWPASKAQDLQPQTLNAGTFADANKRPSSSVDSLKLKQEKSCLPPARQRLPKAREVEGLHLPGGIHMLISAHSLGMGRETALVIRFLFAPLHCMDYYSSKSKPLGRREAKCPILGKYIILF